jgi:hypothetical protein
MVGERCNVEAVTVAGRERHGVAWCLLDCARYEVVKTRHAIMYDM